MRWCQCEDLETLFNRKSVLKNWNIIAEKIPTRRRECCQRA